MLNSYLNLTQLQLQYPASAAQKLFTTADLTSFINLARSQLAGEGECIRTIGSLSLAANTRSYNFSSITLPNAPAGTQGIFNIRQTWLNVGQGQVWLHPRSFEWFTLYALNNVVPPTGAPVRWCQFGQGVTGSLYFDLLPDQTYTVTTDTICYPEALVTDSTPEAIPYPWTDVVPFYAAWYALCAAQRFADADKMMERVHLYMQRARSMSNPDVLPQNYLQAPPDPTLGQHLGLNQRRGPVQ